MKKLICMMLLAVTISAQAQVNPYKKYTEKLPFQMPEVSAPVIPNYTVNLKKFGAVEAINLDGGGSTELVVGGKILNSPSDGEERPVGSVLVLMKR